MQYKSENKKVQILRKLQSTEYCKISTVFLYIGKTVRYIAKFTLNTEQLYRKWQSVHSILRKLHSKLQLSILQNMYIICNSVYCEKTSMIGNRVYCKTLQKMATEYIAKNLYNLQLSILRKISIMDNRVYCEKLL